MRLHEVQSRWPRIVEEVRRASPKGALYLQSAEPVEWTAGGILALAFTDPLACAAIDGKGRALVERKAQYVLDCASLQIECFVVPQPEPGSLLQAVLALFGGRVVRVCRRV
jgi:hypothetical protein